MPAPLQSLIMIKCNVAIRVVHGVDLAQSMAAQEDAISGWRA
jgi:hypothetical protein